MKHTWKKAAAFALATALVAGVAPANVGTGGLFGSTGIVASAVNETIADVYVAGTGENGFLNNISWDPAAESNKMTYDDGIYSITYQNVAAGTYEVKFAENGSWDVNYGCYGYYEYSELNSWVDAYDDGDNIKFTLIRDSDVTLYLDKSSERFMIVAPADIYATGTGGNGFLNNMDAWVPNGESNLMTYADGVYSITYQNVGAGDYQLKFTQNGTWDVNFGGPETITLGNWYNAVSYGGNIGFTLDSQSDITVYLDTNGGNNRFKLEKGAAAPVTVSTVTLNTNGGTINSGNITEYTEGTGAQLPTDVTKNGFDFGGWYTNENFNGDPVTAISTTATGEQTFYAKWNKIAIDTATVNLASDNTVSSITVSGTVITDLSGFDITYGATSADATATFPTAPGKYYAFVTAKAGNTNYKGTATSTQFEVYEKLTDGGYKQKAHNGDKYYTRFVFIVPKTQYAGKRRAVFTITYKGNDYIYKSNTCYSAVISNGITYAPESKDSAVFVVTISSSADISDAMTCGISFE